VVEAVVQVEAQFFQAAAEVQVHLVGLWEAGEVVAAAVAHLVQLRQGAKGGQAAQAVWEAAGLPVRGTVEVEHAEAAGKWPGRAGHLEEMGEHAGEVYRERAEAEAEREGARLLQRPLNPVVHACFAVQAGVVASSLVLRWLQLHSFGHHARSF
jgi:hypothetical protein